MSRSEVATIACKAPYRAEKQGEGLQLALARWWLCVWSRNEVTRVSLEYSRIFLPSVNNGLVGRFPFQGLQMFGKVEGTHEAQDVGLEALKIGVMKGLDGGFLDRAVHALGLPVCPGVIGLG